MRMTNNMRTPNIKRNGKNVRRKENNNNSQRENVKYFVGNLDESFVKDKDPTSSHVVLEN